MQSCPVPVFFNQHQRGVRQRLQRASQSARAGTYFKDAVCGRWLEKGGNAFTDGCATQKMLPKAFFCAGGMGGVWHERLVQIKCGGAIVHFAHAVYLAAVKEHTLGKRDFSGVNMGNDSNVAYVPNILHVTAKPICVLKWRVCVYGRK
jgi:hypothetical protein